MLPIALKSFHIKNYRGIIDTQIDNIPDDTQWIFLTGENGFGKTSVLQALAEGLIKNSNREKEDTDNIKVDTSIEDWYSNGMSLSEMLAESSDYIIQKQFIGYGSTRLVSDVDSSKTILNEHNSSSTLFSEKARLINIEERLKDWFHSYKEKGFEPLQVLFKKIMPQLEKITVSLNDKTKITDILYFEKDEQGNQYPEGLTFDQLAAGYRNIIGIVGDMTFRLSLEQYVEDYKDLEGIVLIDEFELHLHPKYQKLFVEKLTELFPKIQFIVSTHSPIPLLGAPPNSVIINVSRTKEDGIKTELLDIDFSVLTPNTILSSPIFGFQDLIPESKSNDEMVRTEDTYKEVLFHDQLDKQIDEFLTEENKQELLDLLKVK